MHLPAQTLYPSRTLASFIMPPCCYFICRYPAPEQLGEENHRKCMPVSPHRGMPKKYLAGYSRCNQRRENTQYHRLKEKPGGTELLPEHCAHPDGLTCP